MGYFSNGTEGEDYYQQYCSKCLHGGEGEACQIWALHLLYNYDECNNPQSMLHALIPRSEDKLSNEQCLMFVDETLLSPLARRQFRSKLQTV